MDEEAKLRAARNEALFRKVNEAIERGVWPGEQDQPIRFRCECARLDCNQAVELTPHEYERVRQHPRWFIAVPGHVQPEIERIVERTAGYVLVEKIEQPGALASALDPRS
jgi:hypothetical protein